MDTAVPDKTNIFTVAVWVITPNGTIIGNTLKKKLTGSRLFISDKLSDTSEGDDDTVYFTSLSDEIKKQFTTYTKHVFIFSTGIAVRLIASILSSKTTDPAVVVVDDNANHVISLISGHLGGANALTKKVAAILDSRPVITTATDVNKVPAIDMIAKSLNLLIETPENIKHINMAFLKQDKIVVYDPLSLLIPAIPPSFLSENDVASKGCARIYCSYVSSSVPRETLVLRPKVLCVGIGCNRGTSFKEIKKFLSSVLAAEQLSPGSIAYLGTTELKKDETGLNQLSEQMGIPMAYYDKEDLNSVDTIKNPSEMVQKHIGVKSVCEAAAILSANNGELIVPKKKNKDVTIAVAVKQ